MVEILVSLQFISIDYLIILLLNFVLATVADFSRFPRYFIQNFLINRRSYDLSEIQEFLVVKLAETASGVVS